MPLTKADLTRLRSLQEKKHREASGCFVVEGEKVIGELLAAGFPFAELYATEAWEGRATHRPGPSDATAANSTRRLTGYGSPYPRSSRLAITPVTPTEMARISHFPTPSAVLAVGRIARPALAPGALAHGLTLALDGIQDPGNVGTLLRIADWFGLARVLLSPDSADLLSQKVINASMGSFARVAVHPVPLAEALAGCPVPVLGCDLQGTDVHTLSVRGAAVIAIGSEGRGLSPAIQKLVTDYITIPRYGGAESLNAAVAAAIVCDNLRRHGGGEGKTPC